MKINKITEQINIDTVKIDQNRVEDILFSINKEDQKVSSAVNASIPQLSKFIEEIIQKLDNSGRLIYIGSGTPLINYSNIESGWEGEGNIDSDPLFNENYTLEAGSPCINTGTMILGTEYCGEAPDMGVYEYITEDCIEEECGAELGDVSGDGVINVLDIVQITNIILEFSNPAYECAADYNQDEIVNVLDLVTLINHILNP